MVTLIKHFINLVAPGFRYKLEYINLVLINVWYVQTSEVSVMYIIIQLYCKKIKN